MITVYTSPTCMKCMTLKEILEENNYKFKEIDITNITSEEKPKCNCFSIPIVEKDGKFFCENNEEKLLEFLK